MSRKKNQENVSSKPVEVTSIQDMADKAELNMLRLKIIQMEKDSVALGQALEKALNALEKKDQEIKHLQELLHGVTPNVSVFPQHVSDEEIIALRQLESLKLSAMSRDLTLEEIKKFDLLVKNKRLSQGNPTTIDAEYEKLPTNNEDLKKLASRKITPVKKD
jgi:hypothetical protein